MVEIELIDFRGDYMRIMFTCVYKMSRRGLVEMWCYVEQSWHDGYWQLPFPIFTEWWDEEGSA